MNVTIVEHATVDERPDMTAEEITELRQVVECAARPWVFLLLAGVKTKPCECCGW